MNITTSSSNESILGTIVVDSFPISSCNSSTHERANALQHLMWSHSSCLSTSNVINRHFKCAWIYWETARAKSV